MSQSRAFPSLMALRCFEATARLGSMSRAADHLHLTHGAVSRHIRNLELQLGQPLFVRGARQVVPTATGQRLAEDLDRLLDELRRVLDSAREAGADRTLTISCEPTLLMRWLIPRIGAFRPAGRSLRLVAAGGPVQFRRDGIDLAIRRDDFPRSPQTLAQLLVKERVGPVCSPAIADGLSTPADLESHVLLHTRTRPGAWRAWLARCAVEVHDAEPQTFEHFYIALEAATAGIGIAIASKLMVLDALRSGVLVAPFGFEPDGSCYELLSEAQVDPDSDLTALSDFLVQLVREEAHA